MNAILAGRGQGAGAGVAARRQACGAWPKRRSRDRELELRDEVGGALDEVARRHPQLRLAPRTGRTASGPGPPGRGRPPRSSAPVTPRQRPGPRTGRGGGRDATRTAGSTAVAIPEPGGIGPCQRDVDRRDAVDARRARRCRATPPEVADRRLQPYQAADSGSPPAGLRDPRDELLGDRPHDDVRRARVIRHRDADVERPQPPFGLAPGRLQLARGGARAPRAQSPPRTSSAISGRAARRRRAARGCGAAPAAGPASSSGSRSPGRSTPAGTARARPTCAASGRTRREAGELGDPEHAASLRLTFP